MSRLPKPELSRIRTTARRVVEIFTFRTTTPGLTVTKSGTEVVIDYVPDDDGGGGGETHDPVTVAGNGLNLAGQQISLDIGTGATQVAAGNHGHAQLHDAATVSGNGLSLTGQQISLDIGTGATQVAAGNHGHAQLHDAATVSGNGISLSGQQISLDIGTGATQVAAGNHGHAQLHDAATVSGNGIAISGQQISLQIGTSSTQVAAGNHTHAQLHDAVTVSGSGLGLSGQQLSLQVAGTTTIGGVKRNTGVAGQYITGYDTDGNALFGTPVAGYRPNMNYLINGDFQIAQRGATITAPNDGSYTYDRWYVLSDGNGVVDVARPSVYLELEVKTAAKKFGLVQLIEPARREGLIGNNVTFSFSVGLPTGSPITDVRAMIVTSDASSFASRDFVSAWNSSGVDPSLATGWTVQGSTGNLNLAPGSVKRFSVISAGNITEDLIGCMVWVNSSDAVVSNKVLLTRMQLEPGTIATDFAPLSPAHTLNDCQRYYEVIRHHSGGQGLVSNFYAGTQHVHTWYYKAAKRIAPTISLGSGTSWTGGTPTITAGLDHAYFTRAAGAFIASGTSGNVALAADAEL